MIRPMIALLAAASVIAPLAAQTTTTGRTPQEEYQRGYAATPMPNQAAVDAQSRPAVNALNSASAAAATADTTAIAAGSAAAQAQYDADRAAYMVALARHDASIDRTDARYARQQRAYADAMAAWRAQVAACKAGHQRACDMPAPDPSAFY